MAQEHLDERIKTAQTDCDDPEQAVHLGSKAPEPPSLDFSGFVLSLAQTIMIELGEAPHPDVGYQKPDLGMARETIDILAMLADKTRGNLTPEEDRLLEDTLFQTRMRFCEAKKKR